MLKVRVLSAVVGIALLVAVVLLPKEILGIAVFILSLLGIREFFNAVSAAGSRPVRMVGYISCVPLLFLSFSEYVGRIVDAGFMKPSGMFSAGMFLAVIAVSSLMVFLYGKYRITDISITIFGILYIPFLFSFLSLVRNTPNGHFFIWLVFIGAWVTDTFAYFTGTTMGKRKLIPAVSPGKTVEGAAGGVIGCIAVMTAYGAVINRYIAPVPMYHYAIMGLLSGVVSQVGDLTASAIKRQAGIKDYGSIMPGHGGVLDRVDSLLFIAPMVYFYLSFL